MMMGGISRISDFGNDDDVNQSGFTESKNVVNDCNHIVHQGEGFIHQKS